MIGHRCKKCIWWDDQHERLGEMQNQLYGYCRKHRPVVWAANGRHWGGWPLVHAEDLCGEFREEGGK